MESIAQILLPRRKGTAGRDGTRADRNCSDRGRDWRWRGGFCGRTGGRRRPPVQDESGLLLSLRYVGPGMCLLALLPQLIQYVEGPCARGSPLYQETAGDRASAPDSRVAVHVNPPPRAQRALEHIENFDHVLALVRDAVIADRPPQILNACRQLILVWFELIRHRQIDEAVDAGIHQLTQSLAGFEGGRGAPPRVLAGQKCARQYPIRIG